MSDVIQFTGELETILNNVCTKKFKKTLLKKFDKHTNIRLRLEVIDEYAERMQKSMKGLEKNEQI